MKAISIVKNLFLSLTILCAAYPIKGAEIAVGAGDPTQTSEGQKAAKKKAAQKKKDKRKKENKKLRAQGAEINKSILADKEAILESVKQNGSRQEVIDAFFTFIVLDEVDALEQLRNFAIAKDGGFDLVNTPNQGNILPLIYAVDMEKFKSVKWLVRNGADLKATDNDGNTAETIAKRNLSIALAEGEDQDIQINEEIVQEIELARLRKEVGADSKKAVPAEIDLKSASKLKASESHFDLPHAAAARTGAGVAQSGLSEVEKALMQSLGVQTAAELAQLPSIVAKLVEHNLIDLLQYAIQAGADVDDHDAYGYTPLMIAAKLGNSVAAQLLVDHGARTDIAFKPRFSKDTDLKIKIGLKKEQGKTAYEMISTRNPEAGTKGSYLGRYDLVIKIIEKAEKARKTTERKKDSTAQDAEKAKQIAKQKEYEEQRKAIKAQKHEQKERERKKAAEEAAKIAAQEEQARAAAEALLRQKEAEKAQQLKEKELKEAQEREQIRVRLEQQRKEREEKEKEAQRLKDEQIRREKEEKERAAAEQVRLKTAYSQSAGDAAREARNRQAQEALMDAQAHADHLQGLAHDVSEINAIYSDVAKRGQEIIEHQQELTRMQQQKQAREREIERKKRAERDKEWARLQAEAEIDEEDTQLEIDLFKRLEQERQEEQRKIDQKIAEEKARQERIRLEQARKERKEKQARDHEINKELLRLQAQRETQKSQREADMNRAHEEKLRKAKELLLNGAITGDLVKIGLALEMDKRCINAIDNGGNTALMLAISFGHKQVISFLLKHGLKVDAQKNNQGRSTFDLVCLYNAQFDYADLLKSEPFKNEFEAKKQKEEAQKREADRMREEQEKQQKKEAEARFNAKFGSKGLLLEKCESLQDAIETAIAFAQDRTGREFNEMQRNEVAQQIKKAWIFEAINRCSIDELQVSIAAGADLNSWNDDYDGDTPMILAINKGRSDIVEILLKAGANARAENKVGGTPFHAAARYARTTRNMDPLKVVQKSMGGLTAEESSVLMNTLEVVATLVQRHSSAAPSPLSPMPQSGVSSPVQFIPVSGAGSIAASPSQMSPHYPLSQSSSQTFNANPSPVSAMGAGAQRTESKRG